MGQMAFAGWLADHPTVERFDYPNPHGHLGHVVADRQMRTSGT